MSTSPGTGGTVAVTRTYLEMTSPNELRAAPLDPRARVEPAMPCPPALARRLYLEVGREHHWRDRAAWSDDQWIARLREPGVSLWTLAVEDAMAGYAELRRDERGAVEIAYFGLLRAFHGHGLGKGFLSAIVDRAWAMGASRVWLHTCTLDAPAALPNYLARGFRVTRTERYAVALDALRGAPTP